MLIQNHGQANDIRLPRQNLDDCSSGDVGKLRFKERQCPAARAGRPGSWSSLNGAATELPTFSSCAHQGAPAEHQALEEKPACGRLIGSVLRSLSAPQDDDDAQYRIAWGLARLGKRSNGDLANLQGGREFVLTYMSKLEAADLSALSKGVLCQPDAGKRVLMRILPAFRSQAADVLEQLAQVLRLRLVSDTLLEPVQRLAMLLSASPIDGERLHMQLSSLPIDVRLLHLYLNFMPQDRVQALWFALRPEKREGVEQALLSMEDAKRQQAREALRCVRASARRAFCARVMPELRQVEQKLAQALDAQDRRAASKVLLELSALVDEGRQSYGPLPEEVAEEVSRLVTSGLNQLRDFQDKPYGPLNEASLEKLDDIALEYLRHAAEGLESFGLELDGRGLDAVSLRRVQVLGAEVGKAMMDVFRTLSRDRVEMSVLIRQLRDLSGRELQYVQQLADLGQFASGGLGTDDRRVMSQKAWKKIINQLLRDGRIDMVHGAMRHMDLLKDLETAFGAIATGVGHVIFFQKDYEKAGMEISRQVSTTHHLLNGMTSAMYKRMESLTGVDLSYRSTPSGVDVLPDAFHPALQQQYGVAYDPKNVVVTVLQTDALRTVLAPWLEKLALVGEPGVETIMLPREDTEDELFVSRQFYEDGIERPRISLSIRGAAADGQPVRFAWSDPVTPDDRFEAMREALDALGRLAGADVESLTHLMNYKHMAGAVVRGLWEMELDAPFKLADGMVVYPEGEAHLDFNVKQNEKGDLEVATTVTFSNISKAPGLGRDGTVASVIMSPNATSWAQVQFALNVSPKVDWIKLVDLPQFRYHFEVERVHHE
ncbi:hypothetical protein [Alcaligenes sp. WGS1538]|uniref:hypothetical protein n=1 Tax=Alcaligenes sp. WGS1538 TaxID=3366811 RepID=UPI00372D5D07